MADLSRSSDSLELDFVLLEYLAFIISMESINFPIAIFTQRPPTEGALGISLWPINGHVAG